MNVALSAFFVETPFSHSALRWKGAFKGRASLNLLQRVAHCCCSIQGAIGCTGDFVRKNKKFKMCSRLRSQKINKEGKNMVYFEVPKLIKI